MSPIEMLSPYIVIAIVTLITLAAVHWGRSPGMPHWAEWYVLFTPYRRRGLLRSAVRRHRVFPPSPPTIVVIACLAIAWAGTSISNRQFGRAIEQYRVGH
jgi:hypothetical protein